MAAEVVAAARACCESTVLSAAGAQATTSSRIDIEAERYEPRTMLFSDMADPLDEGFIFASTVDFTFPGELWGAVGSGPGACLWVRGRWLGTMRSTVLGRPQDRTGGLDDAKDSDFGRTGHADADSHGRRRRSVSVARGGGGRRSARLGERSQREVDRSSHYSPGVRVDAREDHRDLRFSGQDPDDRLPGSVRLQLLAGR